MISLCLQAFVPATHIKLRGETESCQDGLMTIEHPELKGIALHVTPLNPQSLPATSATFPKSLGVSVKDIWILNRVIQKIV